ncbi:hypothetical protein KUF54_07195 [Comamonas sp. Y33R10-2]|uniref:hypothetical protein n=1 Tax=Comamonas sp. Y33R10-2 TaxID=2853257 RepID=UPI001C5C8602|nr:hypothetical protein [Comamonas sp. Y33R10-2]QXZ11479.1 hypothetical protein KUF54_07195 [Comamonas sp. Y33R10-2]
MKVPGFIPGPVVLAREALIVMGGAIIAAAVIGQVPALRDWIKRQWAGVPNPLGPGS